MKLDKDTIVRLLETNDVAVGRALMVINRNQTSDEQRSKDTKYHNGKGFRPAHAYMGTSMAQFFERNSYLSPKQVKYWRTRDRRGHMRIGIYWRQLIEAAKEKANA